MKKIAFTSLIIGIFLTAFSIFNLNMSNVKAGAYDSKCTVSSTQVATAGKQLSSTILSANETRAWARIQSIHNATNTISLSFDEGASAVLNRGVSLSAYASSSDSITFGRNTEFPYTGAVTGIMDNGSSTVLITECSY